MKRTIAGCLSVLLALSLTACAQEQISVPAPSALVDVLFSFVDENYPNDFSDRNGSSGSNGYMGYVLNAGVICYTIEDSNGVLTKAGVTIDTSLAKRDALSSGAGSFGMFVNTIDKKQANEISKSLGLEVMPTSTTTVDGSTGTYTYGSTGTSILLFWEAISPEK